MILIWTPWRNQKKRKKPNIFLITKYEYKELCFTISNSKCYIGSDCSKCMFGDRNLFTSFTPKKGKFVWYSDNNKGKIISFGIVGKYPYPTIKGVFLVEGLKHDFHSIS